ncbi:DUF1460 domain-containing protein [Entomobacter blattae]|uniref:DUF1460 domain-containing protein n=1 Tax=Entomobacter blattae TaxID=2762277 RepID=A0A7H1NU90_9PROT|nr:DUF1460 domain-containing protein [Entomobacter blattae]QNT79350.1 hypothetical protein JGUZn3_21470 [Entomobacter blattae]
MSVFLISSAPLDVQNYRTVIDETSKEKINKIILSEVIPLAGKSHGSIVSSVSSSFLGTPYQAGTLTGNLNTPEALVVNFNGVDCFVLADYVEALSRSHDQKTFLYNLVKIRYVNNKVDYLSRRHFFSDWFASTPRIARDVTPEISPNYIVTEKHLNRTSKGGEYIPGLGVIPRKINYIPQQFINEQVVNNLKIGDYVGIYSPLEGLDVSHVGIIVRHDNKTWFRNASSLAINKKVVDSPFMSYVHSKPGIIVLRAD